MSIIRHRFSHHRVAPDTETLIIGTFNPEVPGNIAQYFYGRAENEFWRLLPFALGDSVSLQGSDRGVMEQYHQSRKIDFQDMVLAVDCESATLSDLYRDRFIDEHAVEWNDVVATLESTPSIRTVYFTRIGFDRTVPRLRQRALAIRDHMETHGRQCRGLLTPSPRRFRGYKRKPQQWQAAFNNGPFELNFR